VPVTAEPSSGSSVGDPVPGALGDAYAQIDGGEAGDTTAAAAPLSDLDLRAVVAEIYASVDERRRNGDFPPGLERELDAVFARFAPPAAIGNDLEAVLDRAERAAFIDVDVPTASNRPGVPVVKQTLRKAMAWYLRYVAQQVSAMGASLVRADRILAGRIATLEGAVPGANLTVAAEHAALHPPPLTAAVAAAVVEALDGVAGRVLVATCGDGSLVEALRSRIVDAYGTEPRRALIAEALRRGTDVRDDNAIDHLRAVEAGALGAVVLVDVVDTEPLGAQLALADAATRAAAADAVLVIVASNPAWWGRADPVRADLAPGRPLHAQTWAHVLRQRGFVATTADVDDRCVVVGRRS
jgi:hypothetical protein